MQRTGQQGMQQMYVCMYMQLKNFMKTITDIQGPMVALVLTIESHEIPNHAFLYLQSTLRRTVLLSARPSA